MINDLEAEFAKYENDIDILFKNIPKPTTHRRADMCAFHLLDCLCPSLVAMISGAEHDKIWLSTDCDRLAKVATEEQIKFLAQCGVFYEPMFNSLAIFV